jgi:hypothetical protein
VARPIKFQAFQCKSYGEFLEWYYERMTPDYWRWEHCYPSLVFGASGYAGEFFHFPNRLERPQFGLDKFFIIKPGITDQPVSPKLENGGFEWIFINLEVGSNNARIVLSSGYGHLEHLIELLKSVKRGDVPVEFEFDDSDMFHLTLSVLTTSDPDRVLVRAVDSYTDDKENVYVEAIVNRHQMVEAFRAAMRDFLRSDFDPKAWYGHDPVPEAGHIGELILADPWFNA